MSSGEDREDQTEAPDRGAVAPPSDPVTHSLKGSITIDLNKLMEREDENDG